MVWVYLYTFASSKFHAEFIGIWRKIAIVNGVIWQYVANARLSWVDLEDVAQGAFLALAHPEQHAG